MTVETVQLPSIPVENIIDVIQLFEKAKPKQAHINPTKWKWKTTVKLQTENKYTDMPHINQITYIIFLITASSLLTWKSINNWKRLIKIDKELFVKEWMMNKNTYFYSESWGGVIKGNKDIRRSCRNTRKNRKSELRTKNHGTIWGNST